jgi:hypothetical protein
MDQPVLSDKTQFPAEMKKQFKDRKHYGKIRGLTVVFKHKKDIETTKALLAIKLSVK